MVSTGTESRNSLGAGENFYSIVTTIFNKAVYVQPNILEQLTLEVSVRNMNKTCSGSKPPNIWCITEISTNIEHEIYI